MENGESKRGTAEFVKTTIFKNMPGETYRIPSLLYLPQRTTYLAFAEKRTSPADHDAKWLVMRRSITNVPPRQWSECVELRTACLPDHRTMNPCPVYNSTTQTVFLFFICVPGDVKEETQLQDKKNQARLCFVSSTNQGATWSGTEDLTDSVIGENLADLATFGVGPGHGVQLANGRLVVPAYAYSKNQQSESRAFAIYSEDGGSHWQMGNLLVSNQPSDQSSNLWSNECEMAEVIDGEKSTLYCNARTTGLLRVEAQSEDGGKSFKRSLEDSKLVETGGGCQGSIIGFPAPNQSTTQTWLAFSHPTSKSSRRDLGVYLNRAPLQYKWDKPRVIHSGLCGYSDLAYNQDDQWFSCLLECGEESELEQIAFMSFTLDKVKSKDSCCIII